MPINRKMFRSPAFISVAYTAAACLAILAFRCLFPGEDAPLPLFSRDWRLVRGLLSIITLFPAVVFSALVIPFGIFSGDNFGGSFHHMFHRLSGSVIMGVSAAVLYALLFFIVYPSVSAYEENLRFRGELYRTAKEKAQQHIQTGEWTEASRFIAICDSIWYYSPELEARRAEVEIHLDEMRYTDSAQAASAKQAAAMVPPGENPPVTASQAIALGNEALNGGQLLDAHWLATLAGRIAVEGSPEAADSALLASRAWNLIESQRLSGGETRQGNLYRMKLSGYRAMVSGDWIRSYYIFKELQTHIPTDPDTVKFLAVSENNVRETSFFLDEASLALELPSGKTFTGPVFSIPAESSSGRGRAVLRLSTLSMTEDFAFGTDLEYMAFDANARPLAGVQTAYAKFLPVTLNNRPQVMVQMRALDRRNPENRRDPLWITPNAGSPNETNEADETAIIWLDIDYETFRMLANMRRGLAGMQTGELFTASETAGDMGYIPQVYQAEILNRLGAGLFFLPMTVIVIAAGWRLRAEKKVRVVFIPMLGVLPVVFNGLVYAYRTILNIAGAALIAAVGFSAAMGIFIGIMAVVFVLSLFLLAAQRS